MKKLLSICFAALVCVGASAVNFQMRNDYQFYHNYYNPATTFFKDGIYLHGYANYMMNMPVLAGREPLDLSYELTVSRQKYAVFASVSHDIHSYFSNVCLNLGYSRTFDFGGSDHRLSIGGKAVLGINSIDFTHLPYLVPTDYGRAVILLTPDVDLGVEYAYRIFHLGLSVKNLVEFKGRYDGDVYVSFPRAILGEIGLDAPLAQDKVRLHPYFVAGFNRNIFFVAGLDLTLFKNYRLSAAFRGPDLTHNVNASVMICNRVALNLGYSFSTAHAYSSIYGGITVRLAN